MTQESNPWKPIATAPKGVDVIVTEGRFRVRIAAHTPAGWRTTPGDIGIHPTHWMPFPPLPPSVADEIPRRARMEQWTEAERAIYDAMLKVEAMPADVLLTTAVTLLGEARDRVADFVDGITPREQQ